MDLVSVICVCYNHEKFLVEAISSVINQSYQKIEIILVDDASTDESKSEIQKLLLSYPQIQYIDLKVNEGNCKAFNRALQQAKGKYIIDFSTDDIMLPHRVSKQVSLFESLPEEYGVVYSNAKNIDKKGNFLNIHTDKYPYQYSGNIFLHLIGEYFISPPTMMYKKTVLDELNGYDENLNYEDFDFWIRSSRKYLYCYDNEILTLKREVENSHGKGFFINGNKFHQSTLKVCEKIFALCQSKEEFRALNKRILYEIMQCIKYGNLDLVSAYQKLLFDNKFSLIQEKIFVNILGCITRFGLFFYKLTSKQTKKSDV